MATCKKNCIHYPVCGIWDRKVFVDYEKNILSDFSDLSNVEEYCRNYLSKKVEAEWVMKNVPVVSYECSNCGADSPFGLLARYTPYCCKCGAKMTIEGEVI